MQTSSHSHQSRSFLFRSFLFSIALILCCGYAQAQISVTATAGTTGPTTYTTIKDAFDAINLGTHQGSITISVTGSTTEAATAVLNASGTGSASFTKVLVKPAASATPTITGAFTSAPVIKLNGANNVTINGSNSTAATRNLTITNTATTGAQVVVIGSVGSTPVTNDTMRNCTIINGTQTSSAIIVSDAATPGSAGYFSGIGLINNSVQKAYIGMYVISVVTGTNGSNYVADNDLTTSGTNSIRLVGLYQQGTYGAVVTNNTVGNFETVNAEFDRGIWLATGTNNATVSNNTVTGLGYTGATTGYAPIGINISPAVTSANISVTGNSVNNISSTSTGTAIGIYFYSAASGITIDKNQVSNIKNTNTGGYGAACIDLAGTLTSSNVTVMNNFVWDVTGYGTNLWTAASNGNGIVVDGGGGYNLYYNTAWLNTNETATTGTRSAGILITTNVTAAASVNVVNNLLVNTQTVGNANSRLCMAIPAAASVLGTCNYNDYYATSTNLVGQGTNPTIWNTIAQIQSNVGGNANSVTIAPTFTSATDLHLPVASNGTLNNLGTPVTGITTDIDLDPRTTTPDIGADEWGNCLVVTITNQPSAATICEGNNTSFSVAATNGNYIQWQVNTGSGFANISNGGVYGGANATTFTITGAPFSMNGYTYRAQIGSSIVCPLTSSNTVALTVNPSPNVIITNSGPVTFCTGGTDTMSVPTGANLSYQWSNGSGQIGGATNNKYVASTSGSYTVKVTNSVTGCFATSAPTVLTVGNGPGANITPTGTVAVCQGASTTLNAGTTAGVTYQWMLNNSPIGGATANTYSTSTGGVYTVVVTSGPNCFSTSAPTTVNVNTLPVAQTTATGGTTLCQGQSVTFNANTGTNLTYTWSKNGALISGATTSSYTANTAGVYRVLVTNTSTTCKDSSASQTVVVNPLPPSSVTPATPPAICQGDTTMLSANLGTGLSYQWQFNTNNISGANGSGYKAFADGSYTVVTTDGNGCQKVSNAVVLVVHPAPIATVTYSSPLSFCEGSAVVLNAYQGAPSQNYQWYVNGATMTGATTTSYIASTTGIYRVRVTDGFNCISLSDPLQVTVYPKPTPVVSRVGNTLVTSPNYITYQWYLNGVAVGASGTSDTYLPKENGGYYVVITDINGCEGTSNVFFVMNVGVPGLSAGAAAIQVFPNPASDHLTIDNTGKLQLRQLSLINSLGAVVQTQAAIGQKENMKLGELATGLYYLRIETDAGVVLKKVEIMR